MKIKIALLGLLSALTLTAWSQSTVTTNATVGALIPDGNPSGLASSLTLSGSGGPISSVTVSLNISGGYNGDLYAYLAGPVGQFAVLLNRVGESSGNALGYANAGFNITLSDTGSDIHTSGSYLLGSGAVSGSYLADGRNINPLAAGSAFDPAGTAGLSSFIGTDANGIWSLFVADMSGGGQSTLVSWGLTVVTVPEPQSWAMLAGGFMSLFLLRRNKFGRK